jgi:hypothetical protein
MSGFAEEGAKHLIIIWMNLVLILSVCILLRVSDQDERGFRPRNVITIGFTIL